MSATVIRFTIELGFELLITVGAVFYPRDDPTLLDNKEKTPLDLFCIWYTLMLGVVMITFLALTCNVTCRKGSAITVIEQKMLVLKRTPELEKVREHAVVKAYVASIPLESFD